MKYIRLFLGIWIVGLVSMILFTPLFEYHGEVILPISIFYIGMIVIWMANPHGRVVGSLIRRGMIKDEPELFQVSNLTALIINLNIPIGIIFIFIYLIPRYSLTVNFRYLFAYIAVSISARMIFAPDSRKWGKKV
ncbi:hypothetical protein [Companilactobacillus ginsenosidimutans]|uniref:Uncharacterized protein n=1 Tax=Companilactobacillus ginsenosidimutans TaxID=1007676 RepID=A0A0H4QM30_9LACO|nr:hypothetical protein [Companilactobacillus ginsenosidimutans]AKP67768.1 hypothetical protein ABM34_09650 [Companilactobacillus ginsenosidimutans]